jgi:maltooligosyltrehalose trehalohydrolase
VIRAQGAGGLDGAVLGPEAFCLRWLDPAADDRLLVVNLGADLDLPSSPEPLLAPPVDRAWATIWSSEDPRYGGGGTPALESERGLHVLGHAALLLAPRPRTFDA